MITGDYALNRTPENRRIYAEQQVAWFYADLLKAQHGLARSRALYDVLPRAAGNSGYAERTRRYWSAIFVKAQRDLAEAHAKLDALTEA